MTRHATSLGLTRSSQGNDPGQSRLAMVKVPIAQGLKLASLEVAST